MFSSSFCSPLLTLPRHLFVTISSRGSEDPPAHMCCSTPERACYSNSIRTRYLWVTFLTITSLCNTPSRYLWVSPLPILSRNPQQLASTCKACHRVSHLFLSVSLVAAAILIRCTLSQSTIFTTVLNAQQWPTSNTCLLHPFMRYHRKATTEMEKRSSQPHTIPKGAAHQNESYASDLSLIHI